MSNQLFEEETPVVTAPKNGRSPRNVPPPPAEISLSDPFADEPEAPVSAPEPEVIEAVESTPESTPVVVAVAEPVATPPPPAPKVTAPVPVSTMVAKVGPRSLPEERQSLTLTLKAGGCDGLVIVGLFEDGTPGEVLLLLRSAPRGVAEALEAFAGTLTLALPYGVPAGTLATQLLELITDSRTQEAASAITSSLSARFA